MTTFHPFPRLPPEFRLRIWELTIEPRTVDFRIDSLRKTDGGAIRFNNNPTKVVQLLSCIPPPATLQACQESRNHLQGRRVYEQVLCETHPPTTTEPSQQNLNHRYIYISFPTDTLDIGTTLFFDLILFFSGLSHHLPPSSVTLGQKITRLKFTRNFGDEYLDRGEIKEGLTRFPNLQEVYCVCGDGIMTWDGATEWIGFEKLPCGKEGVWVIDKKDNREIKAVKWDEAWRVCHNFGDWGGGSLMMDGNATVDDDEW